MIAKEPFLFFLTTQLGACCYVNRAITPNIPSTTNTPTWLPQAPSGWLDQQVAFGRNTHYFGLNRSYGPNLRFVGDGATIIRYYLYSPTGGTETKIYLNVCKWDPITGIYQPYYKGELELTEATDNPLEGVTCPIIEGGLLKLIKAYEKTMFEIPMDGSIPEDFNLNIHGILYNAILNYTVVPFQLSQGGNIIPLILQTETGMDVGIAKGNQQFGTFPLSQPQVLETSGNYTLSSASALSGANAVTVTGTIELTGNLANGQVMLYTSLLQTVALTAGGAMAAGLYNINGTINLAAGENLFICITTTDAGTTAKLSATNIFVQFNSQLIDTVAICIRPYDVLSLLMQYISNAASTPQHTVSYGIQSSLLTQYSNLSLTSGQALRQQTPAVLKTCLSDFFDAFNVMLNASMGNAGIQTGFGEILFLENKFYVFDSTQVTYVIEQEVQGLEVAPATDMVFDVLKIGYPEQKYDDASGNQEFNTTAQYRTPIRKISKTLSLVSPYRADSNGIETTRVLTQTTNVSNNKSDNDIFVINTDFTTSNLTEVNIGAATQIIKALATSPLTIAPLQFNSITGTVFAENFSLAQTTLPDDTISYAGPTAQIAIKCLITGQFYINTFVIQSTQGLPASFPTSFTLYQSGTAIASQSVNLVEGQQFAVELDANVQINFSQVLYIIIDSNDNQVWYGKNMTVGMTMTSNLAKPIYSLLRVAYESASGVYNPASMYNVENLTPATLVQTHGNYLRSILFNQTANMLSFQMLDKNDQLVRQYADGTIIAENADIAIGSLNPNILFYPFYFTFKTAVSAMFNDILQGVANAHIQFTFQGKTLYGFPMDVKVKPGLNEAQEWKLLCSPLTNLSDLMTLYQDNLQNMLLVGLQTYIPYTCPVQFVPVAEVLDAQFHYYPMDQWWYSEQIQDYIDRKPFYAPWQNNDVINLQIQTFTLGNPTVSLVNQQGVVLQIWNFEEVTDLSVINNTLWQLSISLAGIAQGAYYLVQTSGVGSAETSAISEPIYIKANHEKTYLFTYSHSFNDQSMVFSTGYTPSIRLPARIDGFNPKFKGSFYEDQPADITIQGGIPYRTYTMNIGIRGVPDWVIDKMNRIMLFDTVVVDGNLQISLDSDARWEGKQVVGTKLQWWKTTIREAVNRSGITMTTTGNPEDSLVVAFNINTKGFGDGNEGNNIIQVSAID